MKRRDREGEKDLAQTSEGAGDRALGERKSEVPKCRNFEAADIFHTVIQALVFLFALRDMEVGKKKKKKKKVAPFPYPSSSSSANKRGFCEGDGDEGFCAALAEGGYFCWCQNDQNAPDYRTGSLSLLLSPTR